MQLFGKRTHLDTGDFKRLVQEAQEGSRKAQKALYEALSGKMYAVCLRYMGDRESAEDVLQDGFVSVFTKLDTYSGEGSFEGWARKIFVNTALMALRKKDALKDSTDVDTVRDLSSPEPSAIQNLGYSELLELLSELPPGFRAVFCLYVMEGYSHKDIAEELGISETTSRSQLLRARALLQSKIKEKYQDAKGR